MRAGLVGGTKVDLLVQIRIRQWKECEHRGERTKRVVLLNVKMDQNAGISMKQRNEHQPKASSVSTRRNDRSSRSSCLVCGAGAPSLCISKAFHRRSPQKAAEETRATEDIPQQPACHMSPVENKERPRFTTIQTDPVSSSHADADATVIRKHLWKRASAGASQQPEGSGVKAPSAGLVFSSGCSPSCRRNVARSSILP